MTRSKIEKITTKLTDIQERLYDVFYGVSDGVMSANRIMNRIEKAIDQIEDIKEKLEIESLNDKSEETK